MSEHARLYVVSGPDTGRSFSIGARATLGRGSESDVRLRSRSISRAHARIERTRAGWQVVDLGSTNGVVHEGQRVERAALGDGAELVLGNVRLRFRLQEEPAAGAQSSAAVHAPLAGPHAAGALGGDLGQRPATVQVALVLGALAAAVLVGWGVFSAVQALRGAS